MSVDKQSEPIFVVGPSRSGTAMVRSILNGNSKVYIAGETHFFDDLRAKRKDKNNTPLTEGELVRASRYFRALDDRPYGMKGDYNNSAISEQQFIETCVALGGGVDSAFETYCTLLAGRNDAQRWGEKTPRHVFRIDEIISIYPKARFICLVRDPRAVVSSYKHWKNQGGLNVDSDDFEKALESEENRAKKSFNVVLASLMWRSAIGAATKANRVYGDQQVIVVRYEDIVSDPAKFIAQICDWLGIENEEEMLAIPMHNSSFSTFSKATGVDAKAVDRWRKFLTDDEILTVQNVAGTYLSLYEYGRLGAKTFSLGVLIEYIVFPFFVARAAMVNRHRMGNIFSYAWRRLKLLWG